MRGEHEWRNLNSAKKTGIIPACAGSTRLPCQPGTARQDHPRMRGEHSVSGNTHMRSMGSSPHARGARLHVLSLHSVTGIIPACAGSAACHFPRRPGTEDHPRMRGEHGIFSAVSAHLSGSSPHARGARIFTIVALTAGGSSPHARGAHAAEEGRNVLFGIIPACAGSTRLLAYASIQDWDHPRMRGEHICSVSLSASTIGSSPHARGAQINQAGGIGLVGIIPACAGSTKCLPAANANQRDHPHMRGEHTWAKKFT